MLKANARFGDGVDLGSGASTRLQPPVVTSKDFVLFPRKCPGPTAPELQEALAKHTFRDLPVVVRWGHKLYKLATAAIRQAWAAAEA